MKYYPNLHPAIEAEQYNGDIESLNKINMLFFRTGYKAVQKNGCVLFVESRYPDSHICEIKTGESVAYIDGYPANITKSHSTSPVPIKPLDWDKDNCAMGINCEYEVAELGLEDKLHLLIRPINGADDEYDYFPHETTEQAIQAAQAHHDTQVLALLNLPQ